MCFLHYRGPLISAWFGIRPRCRHDCILLGSSRSSRQSRGGKKAGHSLPSSFRTAGSDGSCVQHGYFWPAVHETLIMVAQDQGALPEGNPVEETLVLILALGAGSSLTPHTLAADASLTGWGVVMSGCSARGLWSGRHLTWHVNCLEMLPIFLALKTFSWN